jgi:hypothetical protein
MNPLNPKRKEKIFLIVVWFIIFVFTSILDRINWIMFCSGSLITFLLTPTLMKYINKDSSKTEKIIRLKKELEKLEHETS